jgi:YHS domain-containing protein
LDKRTLLGIALGVALIGAFGVQSYLRRGEECCATAAHASTDTATATPAPVPEGLALWEPVDSSFSGCAKSCGLGPRGPRDGARVQPGASVGDLAYCPVSGAVFKVGEGSARRSVNGKVLYFCCEVCATYFSSHEAEVLAKRGIK